MKVETILIIAAAIVSIIFIVLFSLLSAKYAELENDYVKCQVYSQNLEHSIKRQNEAIEAANKSLSEYSTQLAENNKTWSKRIEAQKSKIQNVKSCDDSLSYLREMVEGLK